MNNETTILHTQRLLLRPWKESDAEDLYRYAANPKIGNSAGWPPHTSVENSREIIRTVLMGAESYAVVLKESGEVVGSIGLLIGPDKVDSEQIGSDACEIGYWIGEPYWGKRLIPEATRALLRHAFADLHFASVWCAYFEGNEKSRRVQEKCGFTYHHTEENKLVKPVGKRFTVHFTRLTREAWEAMQAK